MNHRLAMDIKTINRTDAAYSHHRGKFLHFSCRGTNEHDIDIAVKAIQTIIVVIYTCQLHIRSGLNGFFSGFTNIAVT